MRAARRGADRVLAAARLVCRAMGRFRAAAPLWFLSRRIAPDSGAGSLVNGAEGGWQLVVHFADD
jgi:hypothetical protein